METKTTNYFSKPLMKYNIRSNFILVLVVTFIFCMPTVVITAAMSFMGTSESAVEEEAQSTFYSHLFALASYNQMTGEDLSAEDFMDTDDRTVYDTVFESVNKQSNDLNLSSAAFDEAITILKDDDGLVKDYVERFEYVYALSDEKGIFSGKDLTVEEMMAAMLSSMGFDSKQLENLSDMDSSSMLNKMYYTVIGLIPLLLFIVIVGNSLIANQVDSGSLAYVLATPTKRSAVANTQAVFLVVSPFVICTIVCIVRIIASTVFMGESNIAMHAALYFGMYLLIEAIGGLCYLGSCLFNQSRNATAFGGGIAVWCFIASILGLFGSKDMVDMGMGIEKLDIFNKLTFVGLYDINAIGTVGSGDVDYSFVPKLCILAAVAIVSYLAGKLVFQKKDLPL